MKRSYDRCFGNQDKDFATTTAASTGIPKTIDVVDDTSAQNDSDGVPDDEASMGDSSGSQTSAQNDSTEAGGEDNRDLDDESSAWDSSIESQPSKRSKLGTRNTVCRMMKRLHGIPEVDRNEDLTKKKLPLGHI
jgi:hypothetical protein